MIGFVTSKIIAQQINDAVAKAQTDRGFVVFWLPGMYEIYQGLHSGLYFIPCDQETLSIPLRGNPALRPSDFPEFQTIIDYLGGLDSRVNIDPLFIIPPEP